MTIEPQPVYLLKDVARLSGQSVYTLKFYLKLGLIREAGRSPETRFRYFNDDTLARLTEIRALRRARKSLAEIQSLLPQHQAADSTSALRVPGPVSRVPVRR